MNKDCQLIFEAYKKGFTGVKTNAYGSKEWYVNGKLHREDGPAVEYANGTKEWCVNGRLHREDGPAVEWADGTKSWWINGKRLSENEFRVVTNKKIKPEDKQTALDALDL